MDPWFLSETSGPDVFWPRTPPSPIHRVKARTDKVTANGRQLATISTTTRYCLYLVLFVHAKSNAQPLGSILQVQGSLLTWNIPAFYRQAIPSLCSQEHGRPLEAPQMALFSSTLVPETLIDSFLAPDLLNQDGPFKSPNTTVLDNARHELAHSAVQKAWRIAPIMTSTRLNVARLVPRLTSPLGAAPLPSLPPNHRFGKALSRVS
ncbi:hypothetical protein C7974DRAFT_372827 [Boeremia exigua]|uniref:uncharacterized protein n=1 Tax=Boeremia exigua TaxID=749465 RepID=UPI001E8D996E|nr:uncharacterized protein C7974DRAFT_372827 [Boeremia exigua]KAH6642982.1 hypothetical protein C7974DRAFT_372827 [Boeremia exigua]